MKLVIIYDTNDTNDIVHPFEYSSIDDAYHDIEKQIENYMLHGECDLWLGISIGHFIELITFPNDNLMNHYAQAGIRTFTQQKWKRTFIYCKPRIISVDEWFNTFKLNSANNGKQK